MCKSITLEELAEMNLFKKNQTEITSKIAYLIGVKEENLGQFFEENPEELKKLNGTDIAVIIRYLSILRTKLLTNYKNTENEFRYNLMNLDRMDLYKDDVKVLHRKGLEIIKANYRVNKYIVDINEIIKNKIDECRPLFPDWLEWKYIKNMFIMPNGHKEDKIIVESSKFIGNRANYPFGMYLNWDPQDEGNVLISDKKFLSALYAQNNDYFTSTSKVTDVNDSVKANIYDFIDSNETVVVAVDCENSDAYRLHSTLAGLEDEEIAKIKKIILYDDSHTTSAWKMLANDFGQVIDFEYVLVDRINEGKSLVDHRMIAGISKEHYRDGVDAFIIVSSDSDYWSIISSVDDAQFLVMVEQEKVGYDIKEALDNKGIYYCYINDFCSSKVGEFENLVLNSELDKRLENLIELNAYELLDSVYRAARITPVEAERNNYFAKNIKTLKLVIEDDGTMRIKR